MPKRIKSSLVGVLFVLLAVGLAACSVQPVAEPPPAPTAPPVATEVPAPTPPPEPVAPTPIPVAELTPDSVLPLDPVVTYGKLSNGMTYYIRHNEEPANRAQFLMVVRAGSVLEEESERGLAHFVEHMAFNGTERFEKQQIVEYLESIGVNFGPDLNASTGFDTTTYEIEVPTEDSEVMETAFQILSDWAYAISFDRRKLKRNAGSSLKSGARDWAMETASSTIGYPWYSAHRAIPTACQSASSRSWRLRPLTTCGDSTSAGIDPT